MFQEDYVQRCTKTSIPTKNSVNQSRNEIIARVQQGRLLLSSLTCDRDRKHSKTFGRVLPVCNLWQAMLSKGCWRISFATEGHYSNEFVSENNAGVVHAITTPTSRSHCGRTGLGGLTGQNLRSESHFRSVPGTPIRLCEAECCLTDVQIVSQSLSWSALILEFGLSLMLVSDDSSWKFVLSSLTRCRFQRARGVRSEKVQSF